MDFLLLTILTFVQLNCENLFDCEHDSLKQDTEYMPWSARRWTRTKYWTKIRNTASSIASCGADDGKMPDFIALCEIENDSVVRDLARRSQLRTMRYSYLITNSPDPRGIDVALLYNPLSFRPLNHYSLHVGQQDEKRPMRDILYVSGLILSGDTLHVFVVHASSRYGGTRKSEPRRMATVERLDEAIDSIRSVSPEAYIIIGGDFNDDSESKPLRTLWGNGMLDAGRSANVRASSENTKKIKGTYKYEGKWESIDHFLVSMPLSGKVSECFINAPDFLIEKDRKFGGLKPKRSWNGYKFRKDGFSDHLPLILRLSFF